MDRSGMRESVWCVCGEVRFMQELIFKVIRRPTAEWGTALTLSIPLFG